MSERTVPFPVVFSVFWPDLWTPSALCLRGILAELKAANESSANASVTAQLQFTIRRRTAPARACVSVCVYVR